MGPFPTWKWILILLACALPHQPVEGNRVEQQWKQKDIMCQAMYRELGFAFSARRKTESYSTRLNPCGCCYGSGFRLDWDFVSISHLLWVPDVVWILDLVSVPHIASVPECGIRASAQNRIYSNIRLVLISTFRGSDWIADLFQRKK